MHACTVDDDLTTRGYRTVEHGTVIAHLSRSPAYARELELLMREAAGLEADPYDPAGGRFRRYAQAVFLPWDGTFSWLPAFVEDGTAYSEYFQGKYNPDHATARRRLPRFSEALLRSRLLADLIAYDFSMTAWPSQDRALPLAVGLTMIKLRVDGARREAAATPDALHQDGETFTFAHLVTRAGVEGGENVIALPEMAGRHPRDVAPAAILAEFNLTDRFASYVIYDPLISHHVNAVRLVEGCSEGERCIMLIDFTPMRPEHHIG